VARVGGGDEWMRGNKTLSGYLGSPLMRIWGEER